jgi:chromosomal replication initiation ATPase DnaA
MLSGPQSSSGAESGAAGPVHSDPDAAEDDFGTCECLAEIAAVLFSVPRKALLSPGRTSQAVSRVRQIAMYVCHVELGLGMREIGTGFSRDRTTVAHACRNVEEWREDPDFDRVVHTIEQVASLALRFRGGRSQ